MKTSRAVVVALAIYSAPAPANLVFSVAFTDPGSVFASYYAPLTADILAAGAAWSSFISGSASLEIAVAFSGIPTVTGASTTTNFLRSVGGISIFEQGAASEIRTGIDLNGSTPDIRFTIGSSYLVNEMWLDTSRTTPVPANRTDAVSIFQHEFAHSFGFNGFLDQTTGANSGFESTYDQHVVNIGGGLFFDGAAAMAAYGGLLVPLTLGNYAHVGNAFPGPGSDLVHDMMSGIVFDRGRHYDISRLDLAVLSDVGIALLFSIPEPGTLALLALGLMAAGVTRRKGFLTGSGNKCRL